MSRASGPPKFAPAKPSSVVELGPPKFAPAKPSSVVELPPPTLATSIRSSRSPQPKIETPGLESELGDSVNSDALAFDASLLQNAEAVQAPHVSTTGSHERDDTTANVADSKTLTPPPSVQPGTASNRLFIQSIQPSSLKAKSSLIITSELDSNLRAENDDSLHINPLTSFSPPSPFTSRASSEPLFSCLKAQLASDDEASEQAFLGPSVNISAGASNGLSAEMLVDSELLTDFHSINNIA